MGRQVEATHFCFRLRHDLQQCVIFDLNCPDAQAVRTRAPGIPAEPPDAGFSEPRERSGATSPLLKRRRLPGRPHVVEK